MDEVDLDGWRTPERLPPLGDNEVQVWRMSLFEARPRLGYFASLLSHEEERRAGRYIVEHAREQFLAARGCLRVLLGNALGIAPQAVELTIGEHGKPALAGETSIEFNVAHAKDVILIALRRRLPVGIDVEWVDPRMEMLEIAESTFTRREFDLIAKAAPGIDRLQAFYLCWTQKEAVTKADGRGLTLAPSSFEVPIFGNFEVRLQSAAAGVGQAKVGQQIFDVFPLPISEDYLGALATQIPCGDVLSCQFPIADAGSHR